MHGNKHKEETRKQINTKSDRTCTQLNVKPDIKIKMQPIKPKEQTRKQLDTKSNARNRLGIGMDQMHNGIEYFANHFESYNHIKKAHHARKINSS